MTTEQELATLKRAGRRMREAQKDYFKTKNPNMLAHAKAAERDFDKLIGEEKTTQTHLPL